LKPLGSNLKHNKKDFTMSAQMNVKPIDEQNYLQKHASLCLFFGVLSSFNFIYILFSEQIRSVPFLHESLLFIGALGFITMMVITFKTAIATKKVKKNTYYYGNFQDEYLNHVNAKGYKYVFNFMCFYLITIWLITSVTSTLENDVLSFISISNFSMFTMGLVFLSYALPVLYMLKGVDDE
jgi:hypothetical protein